MRTETATYRTQRRLLVNSPRHFVRYRHVQEAGSGTSYPFSRDFSTGTVLSPTVPKLDLVETIGGNTQRIDPVAYRSDIGVLPIVMADSGGHLLRYLADPARPLFADIADSGAVTTISVDDVRGYPTMGHVSIGTGTGKEDFLYTGVDSSVTPHLFTGVTRAQRGTIAAAHGAGALIRNGEQIRKGIRVTLFTGYAPLVEANYTEYITLEVASVEPANAALRWTIRCTDIQRFIRRTVFEAATEADPFQIGPEHMVDIALKVMTSKDGSNGAYDVLPARDGVALPASLVDVAGLERLRIELGDLQLQFSEIEPQDAKEWIEGQLWRPAGAIPFVNQSGQYGARLLRPPVFTRSGIPVRVVVAGVPTAPAPPTAPVEPLESSIVVFAGAL